MSEGEGQKQQGRRIITRLRARRAGIAVAVLAGLGAGLVYGPRIASGKYHRAAIERLASDAVGRPVTISGPIVLSLVPEPQLQASDVTIGGPNGAQITAAALKLDLAPGPLLLGRLRATRLALRKPDITLPWPLPGGASAIAPPPWLASLHATVKDGTFRLGPLRIDHADLSIFTGGPHAVIAAGGSASIDGLSAVVTLNINDTGSLGPAPVTATLKLKDKAAVALKFRGTLDHHSTLLGTLDGTLDNKAVAALLPGKANAASASLTGRLAASGNLITWRDVTATSGHHQIDGDAILALAPAPLLRLDVHGTGLALEGIAGLLSRIRDRLPVAATLNVDTATVGSLTLPQAHAVLLANHDNFAAQALRAILPGGATLEFTGPLLPHPSGRFTIRIPEPAATLAALRAQLPFLPGWPKKFGPFHAKGRITVAADGTIRLDALAGAVTTGSAASDFKGALRLTPSGDEARIAARIAFSSLTLDSGGMTSFAAALSDAKSRYNGPVSLSAHRFVWQAENGQHVRQHLIANNLVVDAALRGKDSGGGIDVRLASLHLGSAILAGYGTWTPQSGVTTARMTFTGPNARSAFGSLARAFGVGAGWTDLPAFHHRFSLMLAAAGPATSLRAGAALHLGTLRAAITPIIDLRTGSAAGALSFHAPNAVALINNLGGDGLLGERKGLGWPGPGSASLRASAFLDGNRLGLSDVVVSLGALTASGRLDLDTSGSSPRISGRIAADTLALPAPDALATLARAALASPFRIDLAHVTANRIDRFGVTVATDATFSLKLEQARLAPTLTVGVDQARLAGGTLRGAAVLTSAVKGTPPTLSLNGDLDGADANAIAAMATDRGITLPLAAGTLDLGAQLTAKGADNDAWLQTLNGSLTASGHKLTISNIDLGQAAAAIAAATTGPHPVGIIATDHALRAALTSGTTNFDLLGLTASVANRDIRIDHAALTGADGTLDASGRINLAHDRLDLSVVVQPAIAGSRNGPELTIALAGRTRHPTTRTDVSPAVCWIKKQRPDPENP